MIAEPRATYLFLSLLQAKVGASVVSRLGDLDPTGVLALPAAEVAERARLTDKGRRAYEELKESFDPEVILARLEEKGIGAITLADRGYPPMLAEIPDPPPALFVDGEVPYGPTMALVGSRKASATGIEAARTLGRALGERGVCVTSGLALGIDAAAHEGALEAGGPTIGVLGCGIDVVYPRSNRRLFERVKDGGGILSEYYLGEAPLQWRFPARNRIIAGLSDVVVVVEAPEKSGALITARHALEAGRDVWAVPGPFAFAECRGSNALLADGAGVLWDMDRFVEVVTPEGPRGYCPSSKMRSLEQSRPRSNCPRRRPRRSRAWGSSRRGWTWWPSESLAAGSRCASSSPRWRFWNSRGTSRGTRGALS